MVDNFKTWWRLVRIYTKMDFAWLLRDTRVCLLQIASDAIISLASVIAMFLLAVRFDGFGGMTRPELLFMLGYTLLVNGVYALLFFSNNIGDLSRIIGRGQLDHVLIQPVPLRIHFLSNGIAPISGSGPLLCGMTLTIYAATQLTLPFGLVWVVLLVLLLASSVGILASWMVGISCTAFWAPYAAEEIASEVTGMFYSLAPYPLGGFGKTAQIVLCSVLPIGTMAWLPAQILLKGNSSSAIFVAAVATVFILVAIVLFRKGLQHYAKTSCPRYSGFGR